MTTSSRNRQTSTEVEQFVTMVFKTLRADSETISHEKVAT